MVVQRDVSREDLIGQLQAVASKLGRSTVSRAEFIRETGIGEHLISKQFDSWNEFVQASGLQPYTANRRLSDDELFHALRDAFIAEGGIPPRRKLRKVGRFGDMVYANRFGRWANVLSQFRVWLADNDPEFPYLSDLPTDLPAKTNSDTEPPIAAPSRSWSQPATRTRYGPSLNFRAMGWRPSVRVKSSGRSSAWMRS